MSQERYCIKRLYFPRRAYRHFDDTGLKDEWQLEVYLFALGLMKKHGLKTVLDIGCGSAYKLLTYLGEYETTGLEMPKTHAWLVDQYPARKWLVSDFSAGKGLAADVIICADVIEHLVDPDQLVNFISEISFKYLVISTPNRDLLYRPWNIGYWGPPYNWSHMREWAYGEFREYLSQRFRVVDHRIPNFAQATQMIICMPRDIE
jgi:hypothetical protein